MHHLRREVAFKFGEEAEDTRQSADAITDLGKQLRSRAGTKTMQVFSAALKADSCKMIHVASLIERGASDRSSVHR
jgi:hypothetical protein